MKFLFSKLKNCIDVHFIIIYLIIFIIKELLIRPCLFIQYTKKALINFLMHIKMIRMKII
jgi:hypothetical protein